MFSIYDFITSEMDTHPPPNFLIEFGRITRDIFFNIGGNRLPLPPPPPPCRRHCIGPGAPADLNAAMDYN